MKIKEAVISYTETEHEFEFNDLSSANKVASYMRGAIDFRPEQEQLWVILLDTQLQALGRYLCTLGTLDSTVIHPREVFRPAILASAHSIILVHNHPSGNSEPSCADDEATQQLSRSGVILGIPVVDHVILGDSTKNESAQAYYSYACSQSRILKKA